MNNQKVTIHAGEWMFKHDGHVPSKFWDILDRLNEGSPKE